MKKKGIIITSLIVVAILVATFIGTTRVLPQETYAVACPNGCNEECTGTVTTTGPVEHTGGHDADCAFAGSAAGTSNTFRQYNRSCSSCGASDSYYQGGCTGCSQNYGDTVPEFTHEQRDCDLCVNGEHSHSYSGTVTVEPKCLSDGVKTFTCICGDSYTETLYASGHDYILIEEIEATCTEQGYDYYECSKCGDPNTMNYTQAKGHVALTSGTDNGDGTHTGTCTRCRQSVTEQHTEVTDAGKSATCTETGLTAGSHCSICNATIVAQTTIPVLKHNVTNWTDAGDGVNHTGTCTTCNQPITEPHEIVDGECTKCDYSEACTHSYIDTVVPPTCTEQGYTEHICEKCQDTYKDAYVAELGHDVTSGTDNGDGTHTGTCERAICGEQVTEAHKEVTDEAKEPTCTDTGLTEGSHCSVCDATIVAQEEVQKLGHNVISWEDDGNGEHSGLCTRCYETDTEPHEIVDGECTKCDYVEDHTHSYTDIVVPPTCTEQGYTEHTCECGHSYKDEYVDALGHDVTNWIDAEDGENHTGTCERETCGEPVTESHEIEDGECTKCDYVENHTHNYTDTVVPPTCTEQGYTEHTCECGHSYKDEYVDALGHDVTNWIDAEDGENHTGTCERETCGEPVTEPHEIEDGECTKCDYVEDHTHNYTDTVVPPTCTEQGYTEHTCECGHSYKDEYVDALGHDVTNWTDNGDGTHTGTCTRCGKQITENHKYEDGECKCGATEECTHENTIDKHDDTYHWKECTDCGAIIDKEKHQYDEDGICECGKECPHENTVDKKDDTYHWEECEDCGKTINKEKHQYDEDGKCECGKDCPHKNKEWKADEDEHWQICTDCGKEIDGTREKHSYKDGTCTDCGSKDSSSATTKLPDTGSTTIVVAVVALGILTVVGAIKLKIYKDV